MDRAKLIEAQRRNKRLLLIKEWNSEGYKLSERDFFTMDLTLEINSKIMDTIRQFDLENKYIPVNHEGAADLYKYELQNNIDIKKNYIFFESNAIEIGGIQIDGTSLLSKKNFFISKSGLKQKNGCSIFICTTDMKTGVCLWKGEYDTRIYVW